MPLRSPWIVPVVTIEDADTAQPLADALVRGGITAIEITLRTAAAVDAIDMLRDRNDIVVGAGTVRSADDVAATVSAGARFLVSPGLSDDIVQAACAATVPVLPGVATASDLLRAHALGLRRVKLFPAGALGGLATIQALAAPFPEMMFMPSGGVNPANAADYLADEAVFAVSGSWMVSQGLLAARDWTQIENLSRAAVEAVAINAS